MTQPVQPLAPVAQPLAEQTPTGPDPETTILSIEQLRDAVLEESGLDQEDLDSLKVDALFRFGETSFEVGKRFPGTEDAPPAGQLYVFAMFHGDANDALDEHTPGDQRVYVLPIVAGSPKAKDWRLFTFSRLNPSMRVERMNQATFIEEIGGEWAAMFTAMNPPDGTEDDEPEVEEGVAAAQAGGAS